MQKYRESIVTLEDAKKKLKAKDNQLAIVRLICIVSFVILIYQFLIRTEFIWLAASIFTLIGFLFLIKLHDSIKWRLQFITEKIKVNNDEITFLEGDLSPFENGHENIDPHHPYSYDLDFFGDHSIFQAINRTGTVSGKERLAQHLIQIQTPQNILQTQEAVKELTPRSEWRQNMQALARMQPDSQDSYQGLLAWSSQAPARISKAVDVFSYLFPVGIVATCISYFLMDGGISGNIFWLLFLTNLAILGSRLKSIKAELTSTTKIEKVLKQYSLLLKEIENQHFESAKLVELQNRLKTQQVNSSEAIHRLALLFGRMEHVENVFASPILNGLLLYHIHVLRGLWVWRKKYATHISDWLDVIGEFETLNSLANFSANHPGYTFPKINDRYDISFEDLGHPLIFKSKAITNSISFSEHRFFILTGSNMSGKSTFLRAVGTNMVLAGVGAPVFASAADIHPLPLMVSMRLSDSLADSESLFYAEVKRLKSVVKTLNQKPCFVLLDEILRGTNSDDKRTGTIEVIRKMTDKQAFGGIATHDLEVCNVAQEHPDTLINKRFEVEIINDELVFDYALKDGVCENKSASFIMKKMGVI